MKIVFYCQHVLGIGHFFRSLEICRALHRHRVILVTGGPAIGIEPPGHVREFRDMVKALHREGIGVILDVVFNHTAEGDATGPWISFRGLENPAYYILDEDRRLYANYTGTGNTVKFAEFEQWAGSFEDGFTNALAENLGSLLRSEQIYAHPWPQKVPVKYRVALEVIRFDGSLGGEAILIARWSFSGEEPDKPLAVERSSIQEPTGGSGYEDLVAAESRALGKLSREIAEVILTREKDPNS